MLKKFCIYFSLLVLFILSVNLCSTKENYINGLQQTLKAGDRIVICINPATLLPATTDCIKIDYTIPPGKTGETYAGVNIAIN